MQLVNLPIGYKKESDNQFKASAWPHTANLEETEIADKV